MKAISDGLGSLRTSVVLLVLAIIIAKFYPENFSPPLRAAFFQRNTLKHQKSLSIRHFGPPQAENFDVSHFFCENLPLEVNS